LTKDSEKIMGDLHQELKCSLDDFMCWEAEQSERHEYTNGEVFAMTGARDSHNTIAGNLFMALRSALRGSQRRLRSRPQI
jgi:Uma2 family endonuclease